MASTHLSFSFLLTIIFILSHSAQSAGITPPSQHGMTIIKDSVKNQYFTTFIIGDPPVTFSLLIDLGNLYSWAICDSTYKSTSYRPIRCGAAKCAAYGQGLAGCLSCNDPKPGPACTKNTCGAVAYTPWSDALFSSGLVEDEIFLYTRPKHSLKVLQYPLKSFPFACATGKEPLKDMSINTFGVLTLANVEMAFQSVISKTFKVPRKFALCLPSTDTVLFKGFQGGLFFGGGPYYMSSKNRHDFSKSLVTTPLVVNPVSTAPISQQGEKSVEYFINVRSIEVEGTPLKFNSRLLLINKNGVGGTKISTVDPYTVLHSSIYKALVNTFTAKAKAMNIPRVPAVAPFSACYDARRMANSTSGPRVPHVDFLLDGKDARWRIYGSNLMFKFFDIKYKNVLCLGFVDGGLKTTTSIVIGGKQMEDNIVEIDLESLKIGFNSNPVSLGLSCSQFQSTLPTF